MAAEKVVVVDGAGMATAPGRESLGFEGDVVGAVGTTGGTERGEDFWRGGMTVETVGREAMAKKNVVSKRMKGNEENGYP